MLLEGQTARSRVQKEKENQIKTQRIRTRCEILTDVFFHVLQNMPRRTLSIK